jgi:hypothetical protein
MLKIHCFSIFSDLSRAQRNFSKILIEFKFETIGDKQTDDEISIGEYTDTADHGERFYAFLAIYMYM